jgi:hypothetical protein
MIMVAHKLARLQNARSLDDNYVDAMNYLAISAQFAPTQETPKISGMQMPVEADIAEIARRFAPIMPTQTANKEETE